MAGDGRGGVVAARGTGGVLTTKRRLVSGTLLARVVFSGPATDCDIAHFPLSFIVGRTVVRVGVVRGRSGRWKISAAVIRGDGFGARQGTPRVVGRNGFVTARQYTSAVVRRNGPVTR